MPKLFHNQYKYHIIKAVHLSLCGEVYRASDYRARCRQFAPVMRYIICAYIGYINFVIIILIIY